METWTPEEVEAARTSRGALIEVMDVYSSAIVSFRWVMAFGIGAVILLGFAIGLISMSFGDHDTTFTPSPTNEVFDWLYANPSYRFIAIAVLGCAGGYGQAPDQRRPDRAGSLSSQLKMRS